MTSTDIETFEGEIKITLWGKFETRFELLEAAAKIITIEVLREKSINHPSLGR